MLQLAFFLKNTIFWDITPCGSLKVNRRFGGTSLLSSESKNKPRKKLAWKQLASRAYVINRADVCDMYLRNVGWLSTDYMALYPTIYPRHNIKVPYGGHVYTCRPMNSVQYVMRSNFQKPISIGSLAISIKPEAEYIFCAVGSSLCIYYLLRHPLLWNSHNFYIVIIK
jgi:hypothetical protein